MTVTPTADVAHPNMTEEDPDIEGEGEPPVGTPEKEDPDVPSKGELERFAPDVAMEIPGPATGAEMRDLAAAACTLAKSNLVPKALRGKPADIFLVLLTGQEIGVARTTALKELHVIDGTVTISPKLQHALINIRGGRLGWRIWKDPSSDNKSATWHATRPDYPGLQYSCTVTLADMEKATYWKDNKKVPYTQKDNYQNWPGRMISARARGWLINDTFPEVATGLYTPDELGALTDGDGNPIDVIEVGPYPGMGELPGQRADQAPADTWADREVILALKDRAKVLPEAALPHLATAWDTWGLPREDNGKAGFRLLTTAMIPGVENLLSKIEARAKAGEWGTWAPPPPAAEDSGEGRPPGVGEVTQAPAVSGTRGEARALPEASKPPPGESTCAHPWPPEWTQAPDRTVTCPTCNRRLYQADLPQNAEQAAEMVKWLAEQEMAAGIATAKAQAQAALQRGMCMHPDSEAFDVIDGKKVWRCCGEAG